jgi:hypothetical protein
MLYTRYRFVVVLGSLYTRCRFKPKWSEMRESNSPLLVGSQS